MIKKILLIFTLFMVGIVSLAAETIELKAKILKAMDGDTFLLQVDSNSSYNEVIRIALIDTFETKKGKKLNTQAEYFKITPEEALDRGLKAKEFANSLVNKTVVIVINKLNNGTIEHESRGSRLLGRMLVNGDDYGDLLKSKNLAYDYLGKELYQ